MQGQTSILEFTAHSIQNNQLSGKDNFSMKSESTASLARKKQRENVPSQVKVKKNYVYFKLKNIVKRRQTKLFSQSSQVNLETTQSNHKEYFSNSNICSLARLVEKQVVTRLKLKQPSFTGRLDILKVYFMTIRNNRNSVALLISRNPPGGPE